MATLLQVDPPDFSLQLPRGTYRWVVHWSGPPGAALVRALVNGPSPTLPALDRQEAEALGD